MTKKINQNVDIAGNITSLGDIYSGTNGYALYKNPTDMVGKTVSNRNVFLANGTLYLFNDINRIYDGDLTSLISKSVKFNNGIRVRNASTKYGVGDVVSYLGVLYQATTGNAVVGVNPLADAGINWGVSVSGGSPTGEVLKLTGQTIKSGTAAFTPVSWNSLTLEWEKTGINTSATVAFYAGIPGELILFGKIEVSGFLPNTYYYQDTLTFNLTNNRTPYKIGYAISATEFLVDIDIEASYQSYTNNPSPVDANGYSTLGFNGSEINGVNMLKFSDETIVNKGAVLAAPCRNNAGFNSNIAGYIAGGYQNGLPYSANIQKYIFSSDVAGNLASTLTVSVNDLTGINSSTNGYVGGGYASGSIKSNVINKINFSSDSVNNLSSTLSVARERLVGVNSDLKGYFIGGFTTTYVSEIDGIQFSDETAINPSATILNNLAASFGLNSTIKGYVLGGLNGGTASNIIRSLNFSNETTTSVSATLSVSRSAGSSMNSNSRGYCAGGVSYTSEIDGINFSDETAINPSATLSSTGGYGVGFQSGGIL